MGMRIGFDKKTLEKIEAPSKGRLWISDAGKKGLVISITATGEKIFYFKGRVQGAGPVTVRLGALDDANLTIAKVRDRADKVRTQCREGVNPNDAKRERRGNKKEKGLNLRDAVELLISSRREAGKSYSLSTIKDLREVVTLSGWADKELTTIDREAIVKKHKEWAARSKRGANKRMDYLRRVYNFLHALTKDDRGESRYQNNPVGVLTDAKLRAKTPTHKKSKLVSRAHTYTLAGSFDAATALSRAETPVSRFAGCYYLLMLYVGFRPGCVRTFAWEPVEHPEDASEEVKAASPFASSGVVDRDEGVVVIHRNKNGDEDLELPLGDAAMDVINQLWDQRREGCPWLFPGRYASQRTPASITTYRKAMNEVGGDPTAGDFRKAFSAASEAVLPGRLYKELMGHVVTDVSQGYSQRTVEERIRAANDVARAIQLKITNDKKEK